MRPLYNVLDPVQLGPAPVFVVVLEPPAGAFVWGIPSSREQLLGLTCDANRALLDTLLLGGGVIVGRLGFAWCGAVHDWRAVAAACVLGYSKGTTTTFTGTKWAVRGQVVAISQQGLIFPGTRGGAC